MKLQSTVLLRLLFSFSMATCLGTGASSTAQVPSTSDARPATRPSAKVDRALSILHLEHAQASDAAQVIAELYRDVGAGAEGLQMAVDERTNSVILHAPVELVKEIDSVLQELDTRVAKTEETDVRGEGDGAAPSFRIFSLRHVSANEAARLLSELFATAEPPFRVVPDPRLNVLYVAGTESQQRTAAGLIDAIDAPPRSTGAPRTESAAASPRGMLFYWLATGPDFTTGKAVPRSLGPVLEELERIGLDDVQLVSRSVAALTSKQVTIETTVDVAERSFSLSFQGYFEAPPETPCSQSVDLSVNVTELDSNGGTGKSCSIQTEITTPCDHFVVLGVTGLGDLENAFVIQIQSDEPAKGGEGSNSSRSQE